MAVSTSKITVTGHSLNKLGARCNSGHRAGANLSTCLCIHAEENALLEAGRERIREGSILYCDTWAPRQPVGLRTLTLCI